MRAPFLHPRLDPRLAAVAAFVPPDARVADVGADHGQLAEALLRAGVARSCVATEATPARLRRLSDRLGEHGLGERLQLRCGDGLAPLLPADHLDVLVLAGLGGSSIVRILSQPSRERLGIRRYVLQPATDVGRVRRWLRELGLGRMDERLVEVRGRFHPVIAAEDGAALPILPDLPDLNEDDVLEAGAPLLARRDPALLPYWRATLHRQRLILKEATPGRGRTEALRVAGVAERVLAWLG